jgi:hypothetical protein
MVQEITSLNGISSGYILNYYASPQGAVGNTIHPFNCPHIAQMSAPPRKVWADTVEELEDWVRRQGSSLDPNSPACHFV